MPKSLRFLGICRDCKAYCCKFGAVKMTEKERDKILKEGFKNHFVDMGRGIYRIGTKRYICPYLKKDNSCKIYEVRPRICATWPITSGYKKGKRFYLIAKCPLYPHLTEKEIRKAKIKASRAPINLVKEGWKNSPYTKKRINKFKFKKI